MVIDHFVMYLKCKYYNIMTLGTYCNTFIWGLFYLGSTLIHFTSDDELF
jgi:hypothetical protein